MIMDDLPKEVWVYKGADDLLQVDDWENLAHAGKCMGGNLCLVWLRSL
jgi:hypothetical protein